MARNLALLVVIGALIGGLIGYVTRPEGTASIALGPINLEVKSDRVAAAGDPLTGSQIPHIAIFALVGGLVGAGIGLFAQRRGS